MINRIAGVVGSIYYVGEDEKVNKGAPTNTDFKINKASRIEKVQRVNRIIEINEQEANIKHEAEVQQDRPFKTDVVKDEKGTASVVMISNHFGYREVNLSGTSQNLDRECGNPAKGKVVYFNED